MAIGVIINQPKAIEAEKVVLRDEDNIFKTEDKSVESVMKEVFINASDGKNEVATAISDMGIETSSDSTFKELADNIKQVVGVAELHRTKLNIVAPYTYKVHLNSPIHIRDVCTSVLVHQPEIEGIAAYSCDFDNSDAENFVENPLITYDGTMKLGVKREVFDTTLTELDGLNIYESGLINKDEWKSVEAVESINHQIIVTGLSYPAFIQAIGDINLEGTEELTNINWQPITNEFGVALLLISIDGGKKWKSYNNGEWIDVDISDHDKIKSFAMAADVVDDLTADEYNELTTDWRRLRFGYYLELEAIDGQAMNDSISITVTMMGDGGIATNEIYSYDLSPEGDKLIYDFSQDGTYAINIFNPY